MIDSIKITSLTNIGANLSYTSIFPVVDLSGTPTTKKANLQIIGNYILSQAGSANFVQAAQATLAQSVVNSAQPNITSVGNLTTLTVNGPLNIATNNLKLAGGTNGYVLQTDGAGNLSWTAQTGGNGGGNTGPAGANTQVQFNDAGSFGGNAGFVFNKTTGNLTVPGNINSTGDVILSAGLGNGDWHFTFGANGLLTTPSNVNLQGARLNIGPAATAINTLVNPTIVIANAAPTYIQGVIINTDGNGSSDFATDGADGDDTQAFTDMGYAGHSFSDPNYTVTAPGDGYLFVQGYANGVGGNMVLATGDYGDSHDIVFATGGFATENEFARIDHTNNTFHLTRTDSGIQFPDGSVQTTAAVTSDYGNSNVSSFLASFGSNSISTTGNVQAGNIVGNGQALTGLNGANVTGTVPVANVAQYSNVQIANSNITSYSLVLVDWIAGNHRIEADLDNLKFNANTHTLSTSNVVANTRIQTNALSTVSNSNLTVTSNNKSWIFDNTGGLTFPDNTVQTTAYTGDVANIGNLEVVDTTITFANTAASPVINISPSIEGWAYLQVPDDANANSYNTRIHNDAGNVEIAAGDASNAGSVYYWMFDKTGNLSLPGGGSLYSEGFTPSGNPGNTIILQPAGSGYTTDQKLMLYPTFGDGDHLHMVTGNLYQTELFLGSDDFYVKLSNTGNVVVNANDSLGNIAQWTFDSSGNLTAPGNISANYFVGTATNVSVESVNNNYSYHVVLTTGAGDSSLHIDADDDLQYNPQDGVLTVTRSDLQYLSVSNSVLSNLIPFDSLPLTLGNTTNPWSAINAVDLTATGNITAGNCTVNSNLILSSTTTILSKSGSNGNITLDPDGTGIVKVIGNTALSGTTNTGVGALAAGVTNTLLPNTVASFSANVNSYTQVTLQNKNNGADATADYIVTADNGSDTVNYLDLGIINSGYDANTPTNSLGNIVFAADSYLYAQGNSSNASQSGGNLAIGTTVPGKNVKIFAGGVNNSSIVANIGNTGVAVTGNLTVSGNITTSGGTFVGNGAGLTNVTVNAAGNIQGTSSNVSLVAGSYTYTFDNAGTLTMPAAGGNEGGEIDFTKAPNSSLSGTAVVVDQYVDRLRIFENGGTNRGVYVDLTQAAASVGTLLNNRVSGYVNAGVFLTMDNLKATVTTTGNRGLSLATVSGTVAGYISGNFNGVTVGNGGAAGAVSLSTTASGSIFTWNFPSQGDTVTYILNDNTNNRCYRITLQIGASYNNNMISIERLI